MLLNGMPVVTSLYMTEPKEMKVWLPAGGGWIKHVMRTVQVPRRDAMVVGKNIVIHPAMLPELRKLAALSGSEKGEG